MINNLKEERILWGIVGIGIGLAVGVTFTLIITR